MSRYDAIVVGARCAGASTAMLLAQQGRRVLLLDRATFPRDTLSTLYIQLPGVAALARWGLLDKVRATGCPPLERTTYRAGGITVSGSSRPVGGERINYAPRRHLLDQILVDAAVAAGAEFRDATTVGDLVTDGERVDGVRARTAGGEWTTEHADLVVGADGMRSRVARQVRAEIVASAEPRSCAYYGFWDSPAPAGMSMTHADGVLVGSAGTNDATIVAVYLRQAEFARTRRHPLEVYLDTIRTHEPELAERLRGAELTERLYGTGDQRNVIRTAAGPGWALVGDAACHKDSITAWGISDAFGQAQHLADTLASVSDPHRALAEYAATLRTTTRGGYEATIARAELNLDPGALDGLRRLADDQELADLFFSMASGAASPDEYYTVYRERTRASGIR